jgi:hypothetical protein
VELDDVIDQMIAERVIHRHRRKWVIGIALIIAFVVVVYFIGGWERHVGRGVEEIEAPVTLNVGRFELGIKSARIEHKKAGEYSEAETVLRVKLDVRNIDEETRAAHSLGDSVLRLVTAENKLINSNGAACRGQLNYPLVYGLPAEECESEFRVPAGYDDTDVEIGVVTEEYKSSEGIGVADAPWWQQGKAIAVVQLKANEVTVK